MKATRKDFSVNPISKMAVDSHELQTLLGCGQTAAIKIGTDAKARVQIGRRVLWNVNAVQRYLDAICTE